MKKFITLCVLIALCLTLFPAASQAKVQRNPGGIMPFLVGCCWGLREGTEWNEGAQMHWREWCRIIPVVGLVIAVWDGIECAGGITAHQWAEKNGANWY
ncbi:MAG: hypothetical protein FJ225_06820 [Lentisphaerae bacterium]|nr:hypothetical protein [Lentisphaerota bacterium]